MSDEITLTQESENAVSRDGVLGENAGVNSGMLSQEGPKLLKEFSLPNLGARFKSLPGPRRRIIESGRRKLA